MSYPPHAGPRRLGRASVLAVIAVAVAACGLTSITGPRSWVLGMTKLDGSQQSVTVADTSGRITNVELPPAVAFAADAVVVPAGLPNALDVTWTGGNCDKSTAVSIAGRGAGLAITVAITPGDGICDLIGVSRSIRLTLTNPIPPAAVTLTQ